MASPLASISLPTPFVVLQAVKLVIIANEHMSKLNFLIILPSLHCVRLQTAKVHFSL